MSLPVDIHPHAAGRAIERGITEAEIFATVSAGERRPAKLGRTTFRRNFSFGGIFRGRQYATKQVEAIAIEERGGWLVITVIAKYF
jgi:hypothetical protein